MKYLYVLILIPFLLISQTTQWRLFWDSNSEDDMYYYNITKQIGGGAFTFVTSVPHVFGQPIHEWIDNDVEPGIRYSYYLRAFDTNLNRSAPSDTVSESIPLALQIPDQIIEYDDSFEQIDLDLYVIEPDGDEVTWSFYTIDDSIAIDSTSGVISFVEDFVGTRNVIATVQDSIGFNSFTSFNLTRLPEKIIERVRNLQIGIE